MDVISQWEANNHMNQPTLLFNDDDFDYQAWLYDLATLINDDDEIVTYFEDNSDMTFGQPGLA